MIKDFETYIEEGRMGRLIDAARKEETRKEDDNTFFGPRKEWMLYKEGDRVLFNRDELSGILDSVKESGWRLLTISDLIGSFKLSLSEMQKNEIQKKIDDRKSGFTSSGFSLNDFKERDRDDNKTKKVVSDYGEIELPRVADAPSNFNVKTVKIVGLFLDDNNGDYDNWFAYVNSVGYLGCSPKTIDKASVLLIRQK